MALKRGRYRSMGDTYDWAALPCELIASIFEHLDDYHVDRRRAASTCVSWRRADQSLVNSKKPSCNKLPFICTCRAFNMNPCVCPDLKYYSVLRQSSYYLIISPASNLTQTRPRLIRAEEIGTNKWLLHHPVSWKDDYRFPPSGLEYNFNLLNEYKYKILDVAKLHTLHHVFDIENDPFKKKGCLDHTMPFVRKVVPLSDLATLLVLFDSTGKLALWTEDSRQWSFIDTSYYEIDDIVYHKGQLYAVDKIGRLVTINPTSFDLREIASPPPGDKLEQKVMNLVCSDGYLYLVYKLFKCTRVSWMRYPRVIKRQTWMENRTLLYRDCKVIDEPKDVGVYVFDKQAGAWVRVENLGGKVFFIANYVTFSINARELGWSRGSFVYYMTKEFANGPGPLEVEAFDVYKLEDYVSTKQGDGDLPLHMALLLASSVHDLPQMEFESRY